MLQGNVFVTGGAGFLGRAILHRAHRESWPCHFTVFSRDEEKQWKLHHKYPDLQYIIGDVRDYDRLEMVMQDQDIVIHTAAIKFIPEAEFNVFETIDVNVRGSLNVAKAAIRNNVKKVIGVSTDKACMPVNTYGMTKALMERSFAEANRRSKTKFNLVRYGNVVGSTGSVIPLFQMQKEKEGKLYITDKNMTRFWLSTDEAIDLILLALDEKEGGTIVVPRCGSMRLIDLAELIADGVPIEVIGERPGEKPHEDLIHYRESIRAITCDGFYRLLPAIEPPVGEEAFTYSSHTPSKWINKETMAKMIADAEGI